MKVFQIEDKFVYWDATKKFPTVESTVGRFPPSLLFVEAPDYVFEGWGYDASKEGDERFIQPTPGPGLEYDPETGTFSPIGGWPAYETEPTTDELVDILLGVTD